MVVLIIYYCILLRSVFSVSVKECMFKLYMSVYYEYVKLYMSVYYECMFKFVCVGQRVTCLSIVRVFCCFESEV